MFTKYFTNTCLENTLTELVIPVVNKNYLPQMHLFTRYDALNDYSQNDTFVDALMVTTTVSTFFSSYKIKDKGVFIDGGVHFNNPTISAYYKANKYKAAKKKISVVLMGTGSFIPDSLNPDLSRNMLF